MKTKVVWAWVCAVLPLAAGLALAQESPYVDFEGRPIKALSAEEVEQLLDGQGMGMALPAELNGYPGPKHVLELAAELELTEEQRVATQEAFEAMRSEAVRFGRAVVEREERLDQLFSQRAATPEDLRALLDEIGGLRAELRFSHLAAHLQMADVLTPVQVGRYRELRGYGAEGHRHHGDHGHG